jgi:hypothetical protein
MNFQEDDARILFVLQEANFCSRVLLVPVKPFLRARGEEYKTLKEYSSKNVPFKVGQQQVVVSNLLIQNIVWEDGCGTQEKHPWSAAARVPAFYADRFDDDVYLDKKDSEWCAKSYSPPSR